MPYSVWNNLSLPELTPTCMTLELADRSITEPIGIAEDVFVNVGKCQILPGDFRIVDFEPYLRVPAIHIPNLGTKLQDTQLITTYDGKQIDVIDMACDEYSLEVLGFSKTKELKLCEDKTVESSVDEPPEVELKELPPHLEYAFLEGDDKLPVIIAKDLKDEEKAALLKVLKSHKRAIAWKLSYKSDKTLFSWQEALDHSSKLPQWNLHGTLWWPLHSKKGLSILDSIGPPSTRTP
ncbi:hypothetical protein Tco_1431101 [Tanacetum coccineum]